MRPKWPPTTNPVRHFDFIDAEKIEVELSTLRRKLDTTQKQLIEETAIANQYAMKIADDTKKLEEANKTIQEIAKVPTS